MKKIKFILSCILIIIVFSFIGEIYVWHMDSFESSYTSVTMYLQENTSQDEMIHDIYQAAEKENVEVFTIDQKLENIFTSTKIIYGTDGVISYLSKNSNINPGKYQSIFLGNVRIQFKQLKDIDDISQFEVYYVIGDKKDIVEFKKRLVNKYAGRFPQEGANSKENLFIVIAIWSISLLFLLLITLYEVALMKKEVIIKMIYGEKLSHVISKNIMIDFILFAALFTLIPFILSRFTTTTYYSHISIMAILIFLILNSTIYLSLYFSDYKRAIGSKKSSISILNFSYVYKVISIALVIIVMSGCIELIYKGIDYYKQKAFFEKYKEFSFIGFGSLTRDIEKISTDAYTQFSKEGKVLSLINLNYSEEYSPKFIYGNRGSIKYLQSKIPELNGFPFEEKIYFIFPEQFIGNQKIYKEAHNIWSRFYKHDYNYEIIPYTKNIDIMYMVNTGEIDTGFIKNPVIILSNVPIYNKYWNSLYINNASLFKITDAELDSFVKIHNFENENYYRTNAYDYFIHQWQIIKRNMYIGIVLFGVLILLESVIIGTIIRYEYRINAMEIALKKILGYKLFSRHRKIFLTTLISGLVSLLAATLIACYIGTVSIYIFIAGIFILIIEMNFISFYINKLDKINIPKILKGGNL